MDGKGRKRKPTSWPSPTTQPKLKKKIPTDKGGPSTSTTPVIDSDLQHNGLQVIIDGEPYALNKIPEESSQVVKAETKLLVNSLDLESFVNDLGLVGRCVRIAYNGVGAAGPNFADHQITIQQLGYDIAHLCDKSTLTILRFEKASVNVLADLQSAYAYLLDNFEDMALDTLVNVSKLAIQMAGASWALHKDCKEKEGKVVIALEETRKLSGIETSRIRERKKEQEEMKIQHQEQEQLMKEYKEKEDEAAVRRRDLEDQEDRAISDLQSGSNFFTKFFIGFMAILGFKQEDPKKKLQAIQQRRRRALQKELEAQKLRREALHKMSEFAVKLENCDTEENMVEAAVEALKKAEGVLKHLADIMIQVAKFWEEIQDHCQEMSSDSLRVQVTSKEPQKRLKMWTSNEFKVTAVRFYADWVALKGLCTKHLGYLKEIQHELHHYIRENPTNDDCRRNVKELCETVLLDLQAEQKALKEKEVETQKEIDSLLVN